MVPFRHFAPATAFSLIALALSPGPAAAQTPAVGFTTAAYGVEDNAADTGVASYSLGFEFTANGSNFVTSLGYFNDPSFNPSTPFNTVALSPTPGGTYTYSQSHDVALYQITGLNGGQQTVVQPPPPPLRLRAHAPAISCIPTSTRSCSSTAVTTSWRASPAPPILTSMMFRTRTSRTASA